MFVTHHLITLVTCTVAGHNALFLPESGVSVLFIWYRLPAFGDLDVLACLNDCCSKYPQLNFVTLGSLQKIPVPSSFASNVKIEIDCEYEHAKMQKCFRAFSHWSLPKEFTTVLSPTLWEHSYYFSSNLILVLFQLTALL